MREENKKRYLVFGIIILSVVVISLSGTYAYFVASVGGSGNTTNNQANVTTVDLGSIYYEGETTFTGTDIYPGMVAVQTFKIGPQGDTGTGTYEIVLENNLPEEFVGDIVLVLAKTTDPENNYIGRIEGELVQDGNHFVKEDNYNFVGSPEILASEFLLTNDKIVLEITDFDVSIMKETTYFLVYQYENEGVQNIQQGKTFSGTIKVNLINSSEEVITSPEYESCVSTYGAESPQCKILAEYNGSPKCPAVDSQGTATLKNISYLMMGYNDPTAYLCSAPDDYGTSYFYIGAPENNWVKFGGYYWRIIRINGDGSIRMIYAGDASVIDALGETTKAKVLSNGYDDSTTLYTLMGESRYNYYWKKDNVEDTSKYVYKDNAGVGYMYGNLEEGQMNTTSKAQAQTNTNDSTIKVYLDNWYATNLLSYESYISDTLFCNDRTIAKKSYDEDYSNLGYGVEGTAYRANNRQTSTYKCQQKNDRFTVNDEVIGNGDLTYPIGLLTIDEGVLAGGIFTNNSYYLYTGYCFHTMSPRMFEADQSTVHIIDAVGQAGGATSYDTVENGVRPVINLKPGVLIKGSGSASDPWMVN